MRKMSFAGPGAVVTGFDSSGVTSTHIGSGSGEAHTYHLRFEPGSRIGPHPAGFGQLFLVVEGSGWVRGADGARVDLSAGEGAFIARGESHEKGSDRGMVVLMVQVTDLAPSDTVITSERG